MIATLPFGYNPTIAQSSTTTDGSWGVFVMPIDLLGEQATAANTCLADFTIAHERRDEGYQEYWFDRENSTEPLYIYTIDVPDQNTDLYIEINGWYDNMVPKQCQDGS